MILVALILAVFTAIYWYLKNVNNHWRNQGVKQVDPVIFFGDCLPLMMKKESLTKMMERMYNAAPGERFVGMYQFMTPTLLIRDPELIKQISIKDFDHFMDHKPLVSEEVDPLLGRNLFSLCGKKWEDMRHTLSPTFTGSKMKHMFGLIKETADSFVNYFRDEEKESVEVEMKDLFSRFANDCIATSAFGIKVDSIRDKENEFYQTGSEATDFTSALKSIKFMLFMMLPITAKFGPLLGQKINNFFTGIVYDSIKQREVHNIVRMDMIHLLMEAKRGKLKAEEEPADEKEGFTSLKNTSRTEITNLDIAAQGLVFFFAGFDSVTALMSFMAYELAKNKEIQNRLRGEINETFQATRGKITYEALMKMKYMDMVISETLRKWPNTGGTDRLCTKPYTIAPKHPGEEPVHLRVGDVCWISAVGIHRDPEYFPEPEKFDPERFSDENKKNSIPGSYVPFGIGPRVCIGSRFALLETKMIFCNILRYFEITFSPKMKLPLELCNSNFTMTAKDGIWLNFNKL